MRRREFITCIAGTVVCWPIAVRAQQSEPMRRVGVLMNLAPDDVEGQVRLKVFRQALEQLGWAEGRNLQVDTCWGAGKAERYRTCAAELIGLAPDVILAASGSTMPALTEATRSIPIVFVQTVDPVGSGYVASLARPDGNATGFTQFEYSMGGKWLELLKQIAPHVKRVGIVRDLATSEGPAQFAAIQLAAPGLGVESIPIGARDAGEIERGINAFAAKPGGGLIITASAYTAVYRDAIIAAAARHRLPAVYPFRYHVVSGGLISYGPEPREPYQRAAGYVNRILKGEKPGDLPVQAATSFELVVNLKTAKALGIELPTSLVARANEVIE
jgi:putative ABC transport system substrate-binding protein